MITIESRTQGDDKELKILLQNYFISSRFNQTLVYEENEQLLIENLSQKMQTIQVAQERLDS